MSQEIFDLEKGEALKEVGINLASESKEDLLYLARSIALEIGATKEFVTNDDIAFEMDKRGVPFELLGPAAGSIFRKQKCWESTGSYVKSRRPRNHAAIISVWKLKK